MRLLNAMRLAAPVRRAARGLRRLPIARALPVVLAIASTATTNVTPFSPLAPAPALAQARPLVIESIVVEGNEQTSTQSIIAASGLQPEMRATAAAILEAAERARDLRRLRAVEVHTERGSEPGRVIVRLTVQETRPHLRFGLGHEDLTGWYLLPLQLNMDNLTGHAERFRLSAEFGFRIGGLVATYDRPRIGEPRTYWGVTARAENQTRVYFLERAEVAHEIGRGRLDLRLGRALSSRWSIDTWLGSERVTPDSSATVRFANKTEGRESGEEIDPDSLPEQIVRGLGESDRGRLGAALVFEGRRGRGVQATGWRGRLAAEWIQGDEAEFGTADLDIRGYRAIGARTQVAARGRLGAVGTQAPFYDRVHLGGLYTVRGFPSHSLSPPEGHEAFATASLEVRGAWIGPPVDPRLSGLAFLDVGTSWNTGAAEDATLELGVGYGLRMRIPWLTLVGVDVGIPLTDAAIDEAFHVNASLGWTF